MRYPKSSQLSERTFPPGTFRKILDDVIKTVFTHYGDKSTGLGLTATLVIDAVQIWGSCCGNTTSKDWGNSSVAAYWVNSTQVKPKSGLNLYTCCIIFILREKYEN